MMLIGATIVVAAIVALALTVPLIDLGGAQGKDNYEKVMGVELDADTSKISAYESVVFTIKGKTRANTKKY